MSYMQTIEADEDYKFKEYSIISGAINKKW